MDDTTNITPEILRVQRRQKARIAAELAKLGVASLVTALRETNNNNKPRKRAEEKKNTTIRAVTTRSMTREMAAQEEQLLEFFKQLESFTDDEASDAASHTWGRRVTLKVLLKGDFTDDTKLSNCTGVKLEGQLEEIRIAIADRKKADASEHKVCTCKDMWLLAMTINYYCLVTGTNTSAGEQL